MDKPNIVLTGFMGTGKTTVGKLLARQLDYDFFDTDELIQERAGKTVPEIFQEMGEAVFREMEAAVARELAGRQSLVISTGGRLMLDAGNAAALGRTGRVFCLVAAPEEILDRVTRDTDQERPLLVGPNPWERIMALMAEREAGYREFTMIDTTGKDPEAVLEHIIRMLQD
jgi:shikimate kinase